MPAKSKKQERFMQAVANNPKFAKKVGVPQSVGKEFTKVKKYNPGGKVITPEKEKARIKKMAKEDRYKKIRERDMKLFGPNEESKPVKKAAGGLAKAAVKGAKNLAKKAKNDSFAYKRKLEKKLFNEETLSRPPRKSLQEKEARIKELEKDIALENPYMTYEDRVKYLGGKYKKGGKIGMGMTKNNYKKGGKVSSCSKRADGCAVKGKTKGRMI